MTPLNAKESMFGVGISELPWKLTSLKPRSSAIIITILGLSWVCASQKRKLPMTKHRTRNLNSFIVFLSQINTQMNSTFYHLEYSTYHSKKLIKKHSCERDNEVSRGFQSNGWDNTEELLFISEFKTWQSYSFKLQGVSQRQFFSVRREQTPI